MDNDDVILVPFGPTRPVPEGHGHCFSCDGSGKNSLNQTRLCVVCGGKGYHNAEDIASYHLLFPEVCKLSCGQKHIS